MLAWKELALCITKTPYYCVDADERPQNAIFHQTALFARIKLVLRERNVLFEYYNL